MPDPSVLPEPARGLLLRLATGRGEPPEAVIWSIVEYLVEAEDARAEGTMLEAVEWYLQNELLPEKVT